MTQESPPPYHPAASLTMKHCIQLIKGNGGKLVRPLRLCLTVEMRGLVTPDFLFSFGFTFRKPTDNTAKYI